MAFSATYDPMLIMLNKVLITTETKTAFSGIFQLSGTRESHFEHGRPLSRANDQSCLEAVATSLIQAEVSMTTMIMVMMVAPA
jgi:hypothetical protein